MYKCFTYILKTDTKKIPYKKTYTQIGRNSLIGPMHQQCISHIFLFPVMKIAMWCIWIALRHDFWAQRIHWMSLQKKRALKINKILEHYTLRSSTRFTIAIIKKCRKCTAQNYTYNKTNTNGNNHGYCNFHFRIRFAQCSKYEIFYTKNQTRPIHKFFFEIFSLYFP